MLWEEEILGKLEGNVYAPSINCESLGEAIGANTHVKTLIFNGDMWLAALDNEGFFTGVKQNTSLQKLCFKSCNISAEASWTLLSTLVNVGSVDRVRLPLLSTFEFGITGCELLAKLIEEPNCSLVFIDLYYVGSMNDDCVIILANALRGNKTVESLRLSPKVMDSITGIGWSALSNALCDKSSINDTYFSNHTLKSFGDHLQHHAQPFLALSYNQGPDDKNQVAIKKILHHHPHFDMKPFFEWKMKMLPEVVSWLKRAQICSRVHQQARFEMQKQDAIYQFIHAMPETFESP